MISYLARRLVEVIVAMFAITALIFLFLHLHPGGPCGVFHMVPSSTGEGETRLEPAPAYVNCVDYFHLDQPLVSQYLDLMGNYLHGNLGVSTAPGATPVGTIIADHLPITLLLISVGIVIQQAIALPLGVFAALHRYSFFDGVFTVLSYVFLSIPAFILAMGLIYFVSVEWDLLPCCQASDFSLPVALTSSWFAGLPHHPALYLGDLARHLLLPAMTLALVGIAIDSRFMRAAMLHVLGQDYIRTAQAKGLRRRTIIFKHAFRNALPPIITNVGLYFPALIGSAMVIETVYSYSGIGYTFTQAILGGDTALLQAIFLFSTFAVLLANLVADVAYAIADPRIRYE